MTKVVIVEAVGTTSLDGERGKRGRLIEDAMTKATEQYFEELNAHNAAHPEARQEVSYDELRAFKLAARERVKKELAAQAAAAASAPAPDASGSGGGRRRRR